MERLLNAKVESGRLAIHSLGQSGFALKGHSGDIIVVDPYLSDSANTDGGSPRSQDIPIKPKDIRLNYLFLTHDHPDHTDTHSAPVIAQCNPDALIICPPSSARLLTKLGVPNDRIRTVMAGQLLEFPNFTVHAIPTEHTEDSLGYLFEFSDEAASAAGPSLYITGDTKYSSRLADAVSEYGPDILIVPIGGKTDNMDAADAANLAAEIGPREVIPTHYGMFDDEPANPDEFLSLLASESRSGTTMIPVVINFNTCHVYCPLGNEGGHYGHKQERAAAAKQAHKSHEHHDGLRGPNSATGISGTGRTRAPYAGGARN